jgi:hypothetical protein
MKIILRQTLFQVYLRLLELLPLNSHQKQFDTHQMNL